MYRQPIMSHTEMNSNESFEGETIEEKVRRIMNNKEPITDGAPIVYTERSEGIPFNMDIRSDRFEQAIEMTDKVTKTHRAKREERHKGEDKTNTEPTQKPTSTGTPETQSGNPSL